MAHAQEDPLTKWQISREQIQKYTLLTSWQPINLREACNALNFLLKSIRKRNEIIIFSSINSLGSIN